MKHHPLSRAGLAATRSLGFAPLACLLAMGCAPSASPGLELVIDASATRAPSSLVIFIRIGDGPERAVGARPVDLAAAGLDPAAGPITIALDTPDGLTGEVTVHVVACADVARCLAEPVSVPDCQCRSIASGSAVVEVRGLTRPVVELWPMAGECDRDGDLFPDCAVDGCCDHLQPIVGEAVTDCHDVAPVGCADCAPREAHPFKPAELTAEDAGEGLPLDRHRRWCNDGLDNDCRAEPDVPCLGAVDADGDGAMSDVDCDDGDPEIYPGALDICGDGVDQDCTGGDRACDFDRDGSPVGIDCDDADPGRTPGRVEVCGDGVDQDCDGADPACVPDDIDGDGFPCPLDQASGFGRCLGAGLDCDDLDSGTGPGRPERCGDGIDQDCDGADMPCPADDADGDGQIDGRAGGLDCDDGEPSVFSGAPERCGDGVDQDCDGQDRACAEVQDGDGDGWPAGVDCDDRNPRVAPGAIESCNGVDDDCDGVVDEGNPRMAAPDGPVAAESCGEACPDVGVPCACSIGPMACVVDVVVGESDVRCLGSISDGRVEVCNGIDDDCDGVLDEGLVRPCYDGPEGTAGIGVCAPGEQTCVSPSGSNAPRWSGCQAQVMPGEERCDGRDEDCDGVVDEGPGSGPLSRTCYPFEGQPGVGVCLEGRQTCEGGGWSACAGARGPQPEMCNGVDDDCDGAIDGLAESCYDGAAGTEGVGECVGGRRQCAAGQWSICAGQRIPRDGDACNGRDEDCDGRTDEDHVEVLCGELDVGICRQGVLRCNGERPVCVGRVRPRDEECSGRDEDCDGVVDECPGEQICDEDGECADPE